MASPTFVPPQRGGGMTPPSRREAMLMALGAGLGVLGMTAYYNSGGEEALESTLDTLLDDEDFLDAVADEVRAPYGSFLLFCAFGHLLML